MEAFVIGFCAWMLVEGAVRAGPFLAASLASFTLR